MRSILVGIMVCWMAAAACGESVKVEGQSSIVGIGGWMIDVVFEQPQEISLRLPGDEQDTRYWYVIMSLTNKTGKDIGFYPACDLMTDTYQVLQAGAGVRNQVYEKITQRHSDRYPFLEPLEKAIGKLPQGADYTKDVVIVWKDFDKDARGVKLFISGLSNQTEAVEKPAAEGAAAEQVLLRKTLELSYTISGDPAMRTEANLVYKAKRWVMR
jgi:hypothetical protein